ncbi:MAG: hypothetical protein AAF512_20930, partial [Pseudomonadota bacterium]
MEEQLTLSVPPDGPYLLFAERAGDELAGAGGLLGYARKNNMLIGIVFVGEHDEKQEDAARKAVKTLGAKYCEFWQINAIDDESDASFMQRLGKILKSLRPITLLAPSIYSAQRSLTARLTALLPQLDYRGEFWCYETTHQLQANRILDVSLGHSVKKSAARFYSRQAEIAPLLKASEGLNQMRAWQAEADNVEAFWVISGKELTPESLRDNVLSNIAEYTDDLQDAE